MRVARPDLPDPAAAQGFRRTDVAGATRDRRRERRLRLDPEKHIAQVRQYIDADIDEIYVQQIGPDMDGFFAAWRQAVLPQLRGETR